MGHVHNMYMCVIRRYVYYGWVSILRQEYLSRYRVPYTMYENTFRGRAVCRSAWNQWCVDILSRPQPRHSWQYVYMYIYNWLKLRLDVHRKTLFTIMGAIDVRSSYTSYWGFFNWQRETFARVSDQWNAWSIKHLLRVLKRKTPNDTLLNKFIQS